MNEVGGQVELPHSGADGAQAGQLGGKIDGARESMGFKRTDKEREFEIPKEEVVRCKPIPTPPGADAGTA